MSRELRVSWGLQISIAIIFQIWLGSQDLSNLLTRKLLSFDWTEECEVAFCKIKQRLVSAPVLHPTDLTKQFQLWTDSSTKGFGTVLKQTDKEGCKHPIVYASRATNDAERKYTPTKLEVTALVFALKHFQVYLLGNKVTVYTDH